MLHLPHTNQQENMKLNRRIKKGFTLVELIICLAIGSGLIAITYNVMSQSLETLNSTVVAGTMDNYAFSIQQKIRKQLITAKYIDLGSLNNSLDKITITNGGVSKVYYKNLYYVNENNLVFGIIMNDDDSKLSVIFYPQLNDFVPVEEQEFREVEPIFDEANSNGIKIMNIRWDIEDYGVSANEYNNPDYNSNKSKIIKYQITLQKTYPSKKEPFIKTYHFREVLECAV